MGGIVVFVDRRCNGAALLVRDRCLFRSNVMLAYLRLTRSSSIDPFKIGSDMAFVDCNDREEGNPGA